MSSPAVSKEPRVLPPADMPDYTPHGESMQSVTEHISDIVLKSSTSKGWYALFGVGNLLLLMFGLVAVYVLLMGVGVWGINIPVAWGFTITDFVWWIGIGHAGTLISAILLLLHQRWRTPINRIAEAMTIFALMCAGCFPLLHLGRPWFFFWLAPYPNTMQLWPQFRSALVWDVFAVSTYFLVSLLFWYMGMIPDMATLRDRATTRRAQVCYGILALGWRNSARHWQRFEAAYLMLAGLATPLVVSVHSVVASDFAMSLEPGWHETVFPPYFVAGAIFSGFAMVLVLCIPLRHIYRLQNFITLDHLAVMAKIILVTSLLTSYGYLSEQFLSWYGQEDVERFVYTNRLTGQYAPLAWGVFFCNTLVPQLFWIPALRRREFWLLFVSLIVLLGMWLERYVIIITTLHRDYLPSGWGMFRPTLFDYLTFFGSIGLFLTAFLLFTRLMPLISMSEMRSILPDSQGPEEGR